MNLALINKLRKGEVAIENNGGESKDLNRILKAAFKHRFSTEGDSNFYQASKVKGYWTVRGKTDLPTKTISEFIGVSKVNIE